MIKGELREQFTNSIQELRFNRLNRFGLDAHDVRGFFVAILENGDPSDNSTTRNHFACNTSDDLIKGVVLNDSVVDQGSGMFSQADQHHLHQPALNAPKE